MLNSEEDSILLHPVQNSPHEDQRRAATALLRENQFDDRRAGFRPAELQVGDVGLSCWQPRCLRPCGPDQPPQAPAEAPAEATAEAPAEAEVTAEQA